MRTGVQSAMAGIVVLVLVGCTTRATTGATSTAPKPPAAPTVAQTPTWNTSNVDASSNGNVRTAADLVHQQGVPPQPQPAVVADMAKAPFRYVGTAYKFSGRVVIATDFPPSSSQQTAIGDTVGELVISDAGGSSTPVDCLVVGGTGTAREGSIVAIAGYIVGTEEVSNQLGGKTTQLVVVGSLMPATLQ